MTINIFMAAEIKTAIFDESADEAVSQGIIV